MEVVKSPILYRVHDADEYQIFDTAFSRIPGRSIWDVEKFWSQTTRGARLLAGQITEAGFLLSRDFTCLADYDDVSYNVGLYCLIFPIGTPEDVLRQSDYPSPHQSSLGQMFFWRNGGFRSQPIIVKYDITPSSLQDFGEVRKLETFLRNNKFPFQVIPTMDEVKKVIASNEGAIRRAKSYLEERSQSFK